MSCQKSVTCVVSITDEDKKENQQGASSSDPLDSIYREVLREQEVKQASQHKSEGEPTGAPHTAESDQSQNQQTDRNQSRDASDSPSDLQAGNSRSSVQTDSVSDTSNQQHVENRPEHLRLAPPRQINISQPISSLCGTAKVGPSRPLTVTGEIETITDEEILKNRESEEGIRSIPRFRNYQPGKPSKVSAATFVNLTLWWWSWKISSFIFRAAVAPNDYFHSFCSQHFPDCCFYLT